MMGLALVPPYGHKNAGLSDTSSYPGQGLNLAMCALHFHSLTIVNTKTSGCLGMHLRI